MTVPPEPGARRWCFSTLGCADLPLKAVFELAGEFHIPGIELRGIGGRMDMPQYCNEEGLTPVRIRDLCKQHQTRLIVAGSSIKLASASDQDQAELQTIGAWAESLGMSYVRVFGGGTWGESLTDVEYARAVDVVRWWRKERAARNWQVDLLLETHDAFSASEPCRKLNRLLTQPLMLIWDAHHTWRIGGEAPGFTWEAIGPWVRHVQFKDSVDKPSARHPYTYVMPGDGQMPLREVITILEREQFEGYVSLEWERHWHPYLPPLRDALLRLQAEDWFL